MEEYEPHVIRGNVIYAGVDYEAIVRAAEEDPKGCDVVLWDGGNNDFPFYKSDLHVTVIDPHRPGHEMTYYPGNVTLRLADVVVINKMDSADAAGIEEVRRNIATEAPDAVVASYVEEYGAQILTTPEKTGFNMVGWSVPFIVALAGLGALTLVLRKWVREAPRPAEAEGAPAPEPPSDDEGYRERLERELKEFQV